PTPRVGISTELARSVRTITASFPIQVLKSTNLPARCLDPAGLQTQAHRLETVRQRAIPWIFRPANSSTARRTWPCPTRCQSTLLARTSQMTAGLERLELAPPILTTSFCREILRRGPFRN